jgi:hypothetical protein
MSQRSVSVTGNTLSAPPAHRSRRSAKSTGRFFLVMSVSALVVVLAGFSSTYILPVMAGTFSAKPIIHIHGAMFLFWILLGILQPALVQSGNTRIHRKIGTFTAFYALAVFIMGVVVAITVADSDIEKGIISAKPFLLIPLTDMVLFFVFVGFSLLNYKNSETHKRLMLLATIALLPAPFSRLFTWIGLSDFFLAVAITDSFLFAGILYDYVRFRRIHPAYLWGGALLLFVHVGRSFAALTAFWISIADRIVG